MLQPYRAVLAHPGALAFSSAGVLARLPMSMVGIAVVLAVSEVYGSYGLAGQITAVYVVVHSVCSPPLARLVDRHGQARIMRPAILVATAGMSALVVAIAVAAPPLWLHVAAAMTGASVGSIGALVRARWSHVLDDAGELHAAYSLEAALDEVVFVVGPIVATLMATIVAPTAGLWIPAVALVVGGLLLLAQRSTEPPPARPGTTRGPSVLRSGGMIALIVVFVAVGAIFGATDVAVVAFAEEQGAKSAAGAVLAVFAAGSLLAGLGYGSRSWTAPLWRRFVIGVLALAAGVSLFFLVSSLPVLAAVMFVTGFAIAPTLINGNGLVTELVARPRLTEGLAWVGTALGVGVSVGASVGGAVVDHSGAHTGFLVVVASAATAVIAAVGAVPVLRSGARQRERAVAAEGADVATLAADPASAGEQGP